MNFGALGALHLFLDCPEKVLPATADLADGQADTAEGVELAGLVRRLVG